MLTKNKNMASRVVMDTDENGNKKAFGSMKSLCDFTAGVIFIWSVKNRLLITKITQ